MSPADASHHGHPRGLVVYLGLVTAAAAVTVTVTWSVWPPAMNATVLWLMLSLAIVEAHPLRIRHSSRSILVTANELVLTLGVFALPLEQLVWVVIGGAMLGPLVVRMTARTESIARMTAARILLNTGKNIVGAVPFIALLAVARAHGLPALVAATAVGIVLYGLSTHVLVATAIQRASAGGVQISPGEVWQAAPVALGLAALATPVGLLLLANEPDWPLIAITLVALVMVSRARMEHDQAAYQLTSLTTVARRLAAATSVEELDALLAQVLGEVLRCRRVEIVSPSPPAGPGSLTTPLGDDGPWVLVRDRLMRTRWTRLDQDLLDAVCALAAPERRRLELLEQVQEAERFTSLVLTTAGHDITNHLHAATMAAGTVSAWEDRLSREERHALIERTDRAVQQAANVLRDLVAVGSRGLASSTSAADTALFARGLSPNIHVSADNVGIAAPAPIVERAVENLVRNAQRHHDDDEPLEVSIEAEGDVVRVEVRDRGPGLDPSHVDTLFKPFTQLADDRRQRGSLGLGLFIARGLAESVGGSLQYRDREGGGSIFALTLPSADDPAQRRKERVVLGPRPDRDAQAAAEPRLAGEVADEHTFSE